jgi:hypothetical protein
MSHTYFIKHLMYVTKKSHVRYEKNKDKIGLELLTKTACRITNRRTNSNQAGVTGLELHKKSGRENCRTSARGLQNQYQPDLARERKRLNHISTSREQKTCGNRKKNQPVAGTETVSRKTLKTKPWSKSRKRHGKIKTDITESGENEN